MDCVIRKQENVLSVTTKGKCTFSDYTHFKSIIEQAEGGAVSQIEIDMSGLDYIDSSGLGMLLMLKEKINGVPVRLIGLQGQVKKMADVARLSSVFSVS